MSRSPRLAALLGCSAVLLGAFGAHALQGRVDQRAIEVWSTANRYHFIHALAFLALEFATLRGCTGTQLSKILWLVGLVFFSGGLYLYAVTGIKLGAMLAPIGGLSLAAGWLALLKTRFAETETGLESTH